MKREEMEELISAYIDNELPEQKMLKVESLIRNDAQAKKIHDDFMSIRRAFQADMKYPQPPLPSRFAKNVIQAINVRESQNSSVRKPDLIPLAGTPLFDVKRFANPRIYAFPIAAVLVALCLSLMHEPTTQQNPNDGDSPVAVIATGDGVESNPTISETFTPKEPRPIPSMTNDPRHQTRIPMSNGMSIQNDEGNTPQTDNLVVVCQVEKSDASSRLFPKLFSDRKVEDWKKITVGNTNSIVYEINIDAAQLQDMLDNMSQVNIKVIGDTTDQILEKFRKIGTGSVQFQVEISDE